MEICRICINAVPFSTAYKLTEKQQTILNLQNDRQSIESADTDIKGSKKDEDVGPFGANCEVNCND
jgi:hypothetical protein